MNYGLITPDTFRFCKTCNGSGWGEHDICIVCYGWGSVPLTTQDITNAIAETWIEILKLGEPLTMRYNYQFAPRP